MVLVNELNIAVVTDLVILDLSSFMEPGDFNVIYTSLIEVVINRIVFFSLMYYSSFCYLYYLWVKKIFTYKEQLLLDSHFLLKYVTFKLISYGVNFGPLFLNKIVCVDRCIGICFSVIFNTLDWQTNVPSHYLDIQRTVQISHVVWSVTGSI